MVRQHGGSCAPAGSRLPGRHHDSTDTDDTRNAQLSRRRPRWWWNLAAGPAGVEREPAAQEPSKELPAAALFLVPDPDHQRLDIRLPQTLASPIEFLEVLYRANSYPMPGVVVDGDTLDFRLDA